MHLDTIHRRPDRTDLGWNNMCVRLTSFISYTIERQRTANIGLCRWSKRARTHARTSVLLPHYRSRCTV